MTDEALIRKLYAALVPFAGCVFNDNGEITVQNQHEIKADALKSAYFALRAVAHASRSAPDATDWKVKCEPPPGCSCHPNEAPVPCPRQHALTHCLLSAAQAENEKLREALTQIRALDYQHAATNLCALDAHRIARAALSPPSPSPETP